MQTYLGVKARYVMYENSTPGITTLRLEKHFGKYAIINTANLCFTHQVNYLLQKERHRDGQCLLVNLPGADLDIIMHQVFVQFGFTE